MKLLVYEGDRAMGRTALTKNTAPLQAAGFRVGSHLGVAVLRSETYPQDARTTRERFAEVRRFAGTTGYPVKVLTNQREADALMAGGMVMSNGGVYRLVMRPGIPGGSPSVARLQTLTGHGRLA